MRLILGAGRHERPAGYEYHDIIPFDGISRVFDLNKEWLLNDESVTELAANHVIEHLDNLIHFMDEAWRVLKPGGSLYISTPCAGMDSDLEFADPTHKRCYRPHTFINYFTLTRGPDFGYTDKFWSIWHIEIKENCIIFHGQPIK